QGSRRVALTAAVYATGKALVQWDHLPPAQGTVRLFNSAPGSSTSKAANPDPLFQLSQTAYPTMSQGSRRLLGTATKCSTSPATGGNLRVRWPSPLRAPPSNRFLLHQGNQAMGISHIRLCRSVWLLAALAVAGWLTPRVPAEGRAKSPAGG